mgnify:CR=1 FL=1|tara:strand:+ start:186 stop:746 length:561 start_codon:yes stop_codon:yes gene_type:complete
MSFPKLDLSDCVLVVVDVQGRLMQAMNEEDSATVVENTARMIRGAQLLDVPVLLTEQYPKGLGPTVDEILELLPENTLIRDKIEFSCLQVPEFCADLEGMDRKTLILCGVEAHVCVYQTALDALAMGYNTVVVADGVCSRRGENRELAIQSMRQAGAVISPAESVLFEWLGRAGGDAFKEISRMLR